MYRDIEVGVESRMQESLDREPPLYLQFPHVDLARRGNIAVLLVLVTALVIPYRFLHDVEHHDHLLISPDLH
jgi:hypothetical protein